MAGTISKVSGWALLSEFNILAPASEFFLSVLSFVLTNTEKFETNSHTHDISTMHLNDLHVWSTSLKYQKCVYYAGTMLFNNPTPATNVYITI